MFRNREEAGRQLAAKFNDRKLTDPLVLAIPRGGVVTGANLARELGAELDVVLSQRLQAAGQPDESIGAVTDDGFMFLDPESPHAKCASDAHVADERHRQLRLLGRRQQRIRQVCPRASVDGRSVIVTDDGVVTGSTMTAALQAIRPLKPRELLVAVPVVPANRMEHLRQWCDELFVLLCAQDAVVLSRFYEDFSVISDKEVLRLLRQCGRGNGAMNDTRKAKLNAT